MKKMYTPSTKKKIYFYYCLHCFQLIDTNDGLGKCSNLNCKKSCGILTTSSTNCLISADLEYQLLSLLKNIDVQKAVIENVKRNTEGVGAQSNGLISDVKDSTLYKENSIIKEKKK